jgi:predicted dehydrogenase
MKQQRVGIIGSTGRGNYGHGLDTAFSKVESAKIVAVADDNASGRTQAGKRLKVERLYADYRAMLDREQLDIVCVGPRWITDRQAMVEAAAGSGCHVYCEKPFAAELTAADAMQTAIQAAGVKLQMAHQWRAMRPVQQAIRDVRAGKYGRLLRVRARPKDDRRGGGEELLVHGTHLFDMMLAFAGPPTWVSAHVATDGRDITRQDRREGSEPTGPIAGDSISATIGFENGVRGYFESTANLSPGPDRRFAELYGLFLECEHAALMLRQPGDVFVYPAPRVLPDLEELTWKKQWIEDWHFTPDHKPRPLRREWLHLGNHTLATDLVDSIAQQRDPFSPITHAVFITEIVQGVYASHLDGGRRLSIPLQKREHPLT